MLVHRERALRYPKAFELKQAAGCNPIEPTRAIPILVTATRDARLPVQPTAGLSSLFDRSLESNQRCKRSFKKNTDLKSRF